MLVEQLGDCFGSRALEIVHQDDALAVFFQLAHHRFDDLFGLAHGEIERIHVGGEDRDVALADELGE